MKKQKKTDLQQELDSVIQAVYESIQHLETNLQHHMTALESVLQTPDRQGTARPAINRTATGPNGKDALRARYKNTLIRVIGDLEGTRKAFKSRQIEHIRKELIAELSEIE